MNKKTRRRILLVAVAFGMCVSLFAYKQRDTERCQTCWSARDVYQWRMGIWGGFSVPLTPKWEKITETRFCHDFLSRDHAHNWEFAQGSPYYFFGATWYGCAIGPGRHVSEMCALYDANEDFRRFVSARLQEGSLTRANLISLMSDPDTETSPLNEQCYAFLDAFFAKAAKKE